MTDSRREFSGTGLFSLHDVDRVWPPFRSTFTLTVPVGKEPHVSIDCVPIEVNERISFAFRNPGSDIHLSLEGSVEEGAFAISSKKLFINSHTTCTASSTIRIWKTAYGSAPVTMKCGLTNFHFNDWCLETNEEGKRAAHAPVRVKIDDTTIEIQKVVGSTDGSTESLVTAEVVVSVPEGQSEKWKEIVDDCAWLLTFAACEAVVVPYRNYYSGEHLVGIDLPSRSRIPFSDTHPILPLDKPSACSMQRFLESAYAPFRAYKDRLWLKGLIHYFVTAQGPHVPLEASVMVQAIAVESLCNHAIMTFKEESRSIPVRSIERTRVKVSEALGAQGIQIDTQQLDMVVADLSSSNPDFEDKLRFTLNKFQVQFSDEEISLVVRARNRLVHTGRFESKADDQYVIERYWTISNLVILSLLSILNYHGMYYPRKPGFVKETLP